MCNKHYSNQQALRCHPDALRFGPAYRLMVIDFTVVTKPQIREFLHSNWLHPKQLVNHCQPMKSKAAVGVSIDVLKTKCIWTPVCNLHRTQTLNRQAVIAAKEGPDATHGARSDRLSTERKREQMFNTQSKCALSPDARNLHNTSNTEIETRNHLINSRFPLGCQVDMSRQ